MSEDPPSSPPPREEPTVKQLLEDPTAHSDTLDAATLAELNRWFGMPSAMDAPPPEPTPESEVRRAAALDAVEPSFLAYLQRHLTRLPFMFEEAHLEPVADEHRLTVPERFTSAGRIGEPREIEISYLLEDDLKETVPQALLRDLHRTEEHFHRYLELTQVAEGVPDIRLQIAAAIASGEEERRQVSVRQELAQAIRERLEARRAVPWETLGRTLQSEAPSDVEREPAS